MKRKSIYILLTVAQLFGGWSWAQAIVAPENEETQIALTLEIKHTAEITNKLRQATESLDSWAKSLNQEKFDLLCLGERHSDFYRELYTDVLKKLHFNKLLIEETEEKAEQLIAAVKSNKAVDLLGAKANGILEAALNQEAEVVGVEATKKQKFEITLEKMDKGFSSKSRDVMITKNILKTLEDGKKHVALYGKNHCALNNFGLGSTPFMRFFKSVIKSKKAISSAVLLQKDSRILHPLFAYLEEGGTAPLKEITVLSSKKIKDEDHNYNWKIMELTKNFDYIILL